ncbi:hypothetical protein F5B21DRAFT_486662 [Xylaria acuta]|nr:hypothetical protein F5B21DRAFT_486662 [Xylaria acuta]
MRRQYRASVPSNPERDVYILTLKTNPTNQKRMSELRPRYFPPHLLNVSAYITLFHVASKLSPIRCNLRPVIFVRHNPVLQYSRCENPSA